MFATISAMFSGGENQSEGGILGPIQHYPTISLIDPHISANVIWRLKSEEKYPLTQKRFISLLKTFKEASIHWRSTFFLIM